MDTKTTKLLHLPYLLLHLSPALTEGGFIVRCRRIGIGFGFQGAPQLQMLDEATLRQRRAEVEEKVRQMEKLGGFPMPLYPQEWIEPRTDLLEFGKAKKDNDFGGG